MKLLPPSMRSNDDKSATTAERVHHALRIMSASPTIDAIVAKSWRTKPRFSPGSPHSISHCHLIFTFPAVA